MSATQNMTCPNCAHEIPGEVLDDWNEPDNRPFTVRYEYSESAPTYHSFFSRSGAERSAKAFIADGWGSRCLLMDPRNGDKEWIGKPA